MFRWRLIAVLVFLVLSGCSVTREARLAQKSVAHKGDDSASLLATSKFDLRGKTLEELVSFALTNRPSVVTKALAVVDSRLALKALAADAPVLSRTPWNAANISVSGGRIESTPQMTTSEADWRTSGNASSAVSVDLLLWDFGRYDAKARSQAETVVASEFSLVTEGYVVFEEVSSAYFTYLENRSLLGVALTNEAQYAEHLSRAEARLKAGEANRLDVLKARLDLAKARQTVVTASNLVETTGASLMQALGVDASHGTAAESFGSDPCDVSTMFRGFGVTSYQVDQAFELARTNAPSMRLSRAKFRASSHAVDYAIADLMPTISASTSFNWVDPFWIWSWGVNGALSLFQGFRKTTAVDRAVVAMQSAATAVDEAEQQLSVRLETAISARDNSYQALASARASVRSARENLKMVREQYAVGSASRIELSDAISADSQARGDCLTAFYDGQRAEAALFALLGRYPIYREEVVKGE